MKKVRLNDLGPAQSWAELARHGEIVAIIGEDGRVQAHIVPASEPITADLVAELTERMPALAGKYGDALRGLINDPSARYIRATREIVFSAPIVPDAPKSDR